MINGDIEDREYLNELQRGHCTTCGETEWTSAPRGTLRDQRLSNCSACKGTETSTSSYICLKSRMNLSPTPALQHSHGSQGTIGRTGATHSSAWDQNCLTILEYPRTTGMTGRLGGGRKEDEGRNVQRRSRQVPSRHSRHPRHPSKLPA